jgi:hypothetical protein
MAAGARAKPVFRVVMAYEDFTAGKRAIDTCNFLVSRIGKAIELRSSMWKFDVLRSLKLNQMAVDDAVEADVIIVANGRNAGLPEEVKRWVDAWAARKEGQSAALVALLDFTGEQTHESSLAYTFLKSAAGAARIDFLPQEIRSLKRRLPAVPAPSALPPRLGAGKDPFVGRPSPEAWGIND